MRGSDWRGVLEVVDSRTYYICVFVFNSLLTDRPMK